MNTPEHTESLRTSVAVGLSYFTAGLDASLKRYTTDTIVPTLSLVLQELCNEVEQYHTLTDPAPDRTQTPAYIVHYTTVSTVVSMLQAQAIKRKSEETDDREQGNFCNPQEASLRLYDSAHFNDPDDGNYLGRHLSQSAKHDWLTPSTRTHAYIASFMIPDDDPDAASDNLVFWRTYGREGEGCSLKLRTPTAHVSRVLYTSEELERTERAFCPVLDVLKPLVRTNDPWIKQVLREAFWKSLGRIRFLYKSPAYDYERECRLVIPTTEIAAERISFDFRSDGGSSGRLRHYCEDEALIVKKILGSGSSITIGPSVADKEDLQQSLEILRTRAGLGATVRPSGISYRKV